MEDRETYHFVPHYASSGSEVDSMLCLSGEERSAFRLPARDQDLVQIHEDLRWGVSCNHAQKTATVFDTATGRQLASVSFAFMPECRFTLAATKVLRGRRLALLAVCYGSQTLIALVNVALGTIFHAYEAPFEVVRGMSAPDSWHLGQVDQWYIVLANARAQLVAATINVGKLSLGFRWDQTMQSQQLIGSSGLHTAALLGGPSVRKDKQMPPEMIQVTSLRFHQRRSIIAAAYAYGELQLFHVPSAEEWTQPTRTLAQRAPSAFGVLRDALLQVHTTDPEKMAYFWLVFEANQRLHLNLVFVSGTPAAEEAEATKKAMPFQADKPCQLWGRPFEHSCGDLGRATNEPLRYISMELIGDENGGKAPILAISWQTVPHNELLVALLDSEAWLSAKHPAGCRPRDIDRALTYFAVYCMTPSRSASLDALLTVKPVPTSLVAYNSKLAALTPRVGHDLGPRYWKANFSFSMLGVSSRMVHRFQFRGYQESLLHSMSKFVPSDHYSLEGHAEALKNAGLIYKNAPTSDDKSAILDVALNNGLYAVLRRSLAYAYKHNQHQDFLQWLNSSSERAQVRLRELIARESVDAAHIDPLQVVFAGLRFGYKMVLDFITKAKLDTFDKEQIVMEQYRVGIHSLRLQAACWFHENQIKDHLGKLAEDATMSGPTRMVEQLLQDRSVSYPPSLLTGAKSLTSFNFWKDPNAPVFVLYWLLDLSAAGRLTSAQVVSFARTFELSVMVQKTVKCLWQLDNSDRHQYSNIASELARTEDQLFDGQHEAVLERLLDAQCNEDAVYYWQMKRNWITSLERPCLPVDVLLSENYIQLAFDEARAADNMTNSSEQAPCMRHFFQACLQKRQFSALLTLPMLPREEAMLEDVISSSDNPEWKELLVMAFLRQGRIAEAFTINSQLPTNTDRTRSRQILLKNYRSLLPRVTRDLVGSQAQMTAAMAPSTTAAAAAMDVDEDQTAQQSVLQAQRLLGTDLVKAAQDQSFVPTSIARRLLRDEARERPSSAEDGQTMPFVGPPSTPVWSSKKSASRVSALRRRVLEGAPTAGSANASFDLDGSLFTSPTTKTQLRPHMASFIFNTPPLDQDAVEDVDEDGSFVGSQSVLFENLRQTPLKPNLKARLARLEESFQASPSSGSIQDSSTDSVISFNPRNTRRDDNQQSAAQEASGLPLSRPAFDEDERMMDVDTAAQLPEPSNTSHHIGGEQGSQTQAHSERTSPERTGLSALSSQHTSLVADEEESFERVDASSDDHQATSSAVAASTDDATSAAKQPQGLRGLLLGTPPAALTLSAQQQYTAQFMGENSPQAAASASFSVAEASTPASVHHQDHEDGTVTQRAAEMEVDEPAPKSPVASPAPNTPPSRKHAHHAVERVRKQVGPSSPLGQASTSAADLVLSSALYSASTSQLAGGSEPAYASTPARREQDTAAYKASVALYGLDDAAEESVAVEGDESFQPILPASQSPKTPSKKRPAKKMITPRSSRTSSPLVKHSPKMSPQVSSMVVDAHQDAPSPPITRSAARRQGRQMVREAGSSARSLRAPTAEADDTDSPVQLVRPTRSSGSAMKTPSRKLRSKHGKSKLDSSFTAHRPATRSQTRREGDDENDQ